MFMFSLAKWSYCEENREGASFLQKEVLDNGSRDVMCTQQINTDQARVGRQIHAKGDRYKSILVCHSLILSSSFTLT